MPDTFWTPDDSRLNGYRTQPLYTIGEAAHLAHVSPATVRRWLFGYAPDSRHPWYKTPPIFDGNEPGNPYVSFLQLVEIVMARLFRQVGHVRLDRVKAAYENAKAESGIEYPFAHMELESLGGHVIQWLKGEPTSEAEALDSPGQRSLPGLVTEEILRLDYERHLARRWYPIGKDVPIVVDPQFSSGLPTVVGRGVTVAAVYRRWKKANLSFEFIADDLQVEKGLIEQVIRYADQIAA
jgi:uncharacterized protein (DUF433 family)